MFSLLTVYFWLLTCTPGDNLYNRYGHTSIRALDTERNLDLCFNYGTFSFNSDNFYWKFVKGETYYMLDVERTEDFLENYVDENRVVYSQELNLSQQQGQRLFQLLLENARPENSEYLYNFVFDNCSTRAYGILTKCLSDEITSSYTGNKGNTYRRFIERYTGKGAVINSLINMVFGRDADRKMGDKDRLFLPEELMFYVEDAHFSDGTPLVKSSFIAPFDIKPVVWYDRTVLYILLFAVLLMLLSLYDRRRGRLSWSVDIIVGVVYVLLLAVDIFLVFFSIHPLVGLNWRLLVIPVVYLCARLPYILR